MKDLRKFYRNVGRNASKSISENVAIFSILKNIKSIKELKNALKK